MRLDQLSLKILLWFTLSLQIYKFIFSQTYTFFLHSLVYLGKVIFRPVVVKTNKTALNKWL